MSDDLVKRLRSREQADRLVCTGPGVVEMTYEPDALCQEAAARIKELEAKLAKALIAELKGQDDA